MVLYYFERTPEADIKLIIISDTAPHKLTISSHQKV